MQEKSVCLILSVLFAVVIVSNGEPFHYYGFPSPHKTGFQSHHLIIGSRMPGDRLVCREHVVKPSRFWSVVTHQRTFNVSKYERITQIRAIDQKINGKGAVARLIKGGPGASAATLYFKSQRGHGINFVVEMYARH